MIGSASPVMKKYIRYPLQWVLTNKVKRILRKKVDIDCIPYYNVGQDPRQGNLRLEHDNTPPNGQKQHEDTS